MADSVTINPGSIGSSNTELSREILASEKIIEDAMFRLQGFVRLQTEEGSFKVVALAERRYDPASIAWMRGKLQEVLNKNLYLSNLSEDDMYDEARFIAMGFDEELWLHWETFSLNVERYKELSEMHRNFLAQAIRHPLKEGIRKLLKDTTQESTQNVRQTVSETQQKSGLLGGLLGR